jgi:hypothetical protein
MSQTDKEHFLELLRPFCKAEAMEHARAAFNGNADAALQLSVALTNELRGTVAVAMWRTRVQRETYREYLRSVWCHDHQFVIGAAVDRRTLSYMFQYAAFPLPTGLPEVVTMWRGTSGLSVDTARKGYSWTTDRDTACWFAMRFPELGAPLLLTTGVAKNSVALFHNGTNESEAVLIRPPTNVHVDGGPDDWIQGSQRKSIAIKLRRSV